jgi:septum formation protein
MIILASTSSTRRRLLEAAGVKHTAVPPQTDERQVKLAHKHLPPDQLALLLAQEKAGSITASRQDLVIGCDQILSCEGRMFDKPRDMADAADHLRFLQGRTHTLHTAVVCTMDNGQSHNIISEPNLTMRPLSDGEIEHYLQSAGPAILGSVGCYQIEGLGAQLFEAIDGDIFSIQGLPLLPLLAHLRSLNLLTP